MNDLPVTPLAKSSFNFDELSQNNTGRVFGEGRPHLPVKEMLMISRIVEINDNGGDFGKGLIHAELDINPDLWFFDCHFVGDPVMPGCLGLDAMWQLVGFYLGWRGYAGKGRALGSGEVKFVDQITRDVDKITYKIHINRMITRKLTMGIANGEVLIGDKVIYSAKDLKVGLFENS